MIASVGFSHIHEVRRVEQIVRNNLIDQRATSRERRRHR